MRKTFVLEEIVAMLQVTKASKETIANFKKQAEFVAEKRNQKTNEEVSVGSVFGSDTQRGYVEFVINDQLTQMEPKKAREIGLMLLEAAEAATSDEIFVTMLKEIGIETEHVGGVLVKLREIRQGTRGTSWPS